MNNFALLAFITITILIFTVLGLKAGRSGRIISGIFFTLCTVYFFAVTVKAIQSGSNAVFFSGSITYISAVLGCGFTTGWIRGKNEQIQTTKN